MEETETTCARKIHQWKFWKYKKEKMNKNKEKKERAYTLFRTLPTTEIGKRSWAIDREAYNNTAERIVKGTKKRAYRKSYSVCPRN